MFRNGIGRLVALIVMAVVLAGSLAMPAAAQSETIDANVGICSQRVSSYSVQLQSGVQMSPYPDRSAFPNSVTLVFADGSTAQATSLLGPNGGTMTYKLGGQYRDTALVRAFADFDTTDYPDYRFTVTAWPCDRTPDLSGSIFQHGNMKPVSGIEVCIVELSRCTTTDETGAFAFSDLPSAFSSYTLVSDGPVYKRLSTTVTVEGEDVYVDLLQYRGGGQD